MMNCTELDLAVSQVHSLYMEEDAAFATVALSIFLVSLLFIAQGEELMRPLATIVGSSVGAVAVFILTALFVDDCLARLVISGVAGVLVALLALCALKSGIFILGSAGFASITHLVYDTLPLDDVEPPFRILGRSGYYYIAMAVAVVGGAIIAYWQKKSFIRITSSLIGGGGLTFTIWLVCDRVGENVPSLALLVVLVLSVCIGVPLQKYIKKRREKRKQERKQKKYVPQGIPVFVSP